MAYCTIEEVTALFGNLPDDTDEDMVEVAINNSTAWIDANLKRHYLPIPTDNPQALKTVSIYHSASDVILNLYQGVDLPVQYDTWFNKAQDLLEEYIGAETGNTDDASILSNNSTVGYKKGKGYTRKWKI